MAKPNGRAAKAREWLAAQNTSNLVLERVPPGRPSKTGFVQVIQVGKYFQPRLQIKGEVKGAVRKRAQHALQGTYPPLTG